MLPAKRYIIRLITLLVALQLLNLSIYAQDFKPIYDEAGTDEVNINETIVEYVVEVVLGHTGAIPEQSQHNKDLHFHKHISFKVIAAGKPLPSFAIRFDAAKMPVPLHEAFEDRYLRRIDPQPPKAFLHS